ncbi:phage tail tape measure protein [Pseudomonas syringae group genomosp. 3]|uniref:phage tail tape measure protein n=1 Tax=Pseudomonas syringae group genomosp. 3 TaxID=251701 RepID=UPI001C82B29E|nr:phage tail tape measure protein [Pseudomonas syringae group genomosp. 3]MBX6410173.1 phage tail tape measure protein [Pseudomonas syringae pv. tomato]MBX6428975.1 phage tail tape measure protein [Pseudomonas syringae pv. tomato]MBX6451919.1 phage tail tape measure protein [Pseudomonas syringae pv. tomato]MBX6486651.1 phage tail tape measure protein [Pseudomonas syringae pv. tomato]MBX6525591.1 phage tail tape measure protein [Pseudomonas syringae pv. tomato]
MADRSARLAFILNLTDKVSAPLGKVKTTFSDLAEQSQQNIIQMGAGLAGMVGAGKAITESLEPALEVNRALGDMRALGTAEDALASLNRKALEFSITYATSAAEFVGSSRVIDGAIKGLVGGQLAAITSSSNLLAKVTKADAETTGAYLGTMYNLFKTEADKMGKVEWVEQLTGQTALAVKLFRTDGAQLKDAFKEVGAIATQAGVGVAEQMAVIGTLSSTMEGGDAGGRYKAFFENIGAAAEKTGLSFTDAAGNTLPMIQILDKLQGKYGDLTSAAAGTKLVEAFGGEGAQVIGALAKDTDRLRHGISELGKVRGLENAEKMAKAMVDPWQQFGKAVDALRISFGQSLIPTLTPLMERLVGIASTLTRWMQLFPNITRVIGITTLIILGFVAAMSLLTLVVGVSKMVWLGMLTVWKLLNWQGFKSIAMFLFHTVLVAAFAAGLVILYTWMGLVRLGMLLWQGAIWLVNAAMLANPVLLIVAGIVLLVAAVVYWDELCAALMNTTAFQWISDQLSTLSNWFGSMGGWSGIAKTAWDSILATVKGAINGLIEMANKIPGVNIETTFGDLPEPPKVPDLPGQVGAPVPGPQLPAVVTTPPAGTVQGPKVASAAPAPASQPPKPLALVPAAVTRSAPAQVPAPAVQVQPAPPISLPQPNVLPFKPLQMPAPQIKQAEPIMLPPASADLAFSMPTKAALPARVEKVIEMPAKSDKGIEARKAINANTSISPTKPQAVPKGGLMQSFQNQSNAMNPNQRAGTHVETLNINTAKPMTPLELENMMAMAVGG